MGRNASTILSADFETTTLFHDCRVWAWGYCNIETPDDMVWGTTIEEFIDHIATFNSIVYFHNLKFDGTFILDYLLKNGFKNYSNYDNSARMPVGYFETLISDMNKYYTIKVRWDDKHSTEFRDSAKKFPNMSVARIAKTFNLPMSKGEIDYDAPRPIGYEPNEEELDYLHRDVSIVAMALKIAMDSGMKRLTVASDSIEEYKRIVGTQMFEKFFPVLSEDADTDIRRAYKGGYTYADSRFSGTIQNKKGIVLDVNSLYPSVMYNCLMPYGEPVFFSGAYTVDSIYPLYIFTVTITAKLKPGHLPCIQLKGSVIFGASEYVTEINEPTMISVTNVDWELYNDHYNITVISYEGGWKFKGTYGLFDSYIDKWMEVKRNSVGGQREIAKLHLNSLYGKFGSNPNVTGKFPIIENDRVKLVRGPDQRRNPIYTAIAVYTTAYGRDLTIRSGQNNYDNFAYADTDSLHLLTDKLPDLAIDPSELGKWKIEYEFNRALYVRPKAYIEEKTDGSRVVKWAGIPEEISSQFDFSDVWEGRVITGKLHPINVPGGVVLESVPYTIRL